MPLCKKFSLIRYQCFTRSDTIKIKTVDVKFWSHLLQSRVWFQSLACSRKWLKYFLVFQHSHNHLWLELLFIPKMLDKPTYQFKCQWHLNRCSKTFGQTHTYSHMRITKLNPCMATFLTWYPIAKLFEGLESFSSATTITLELIVLTSELLHALMQTFDWVIAALAIWPSSKLTHMRSAVKWFLAFSFLHGFIPYEQTINKHWYRNLIFFL